MKKISLSLAALCASGMASAQTSQVTLFGVADVMLSRYQNSGGPSVTKLVSGGLQASRIGVRGVESLGDGLNASFWLEGDTQFDSGIGGSSNTSNQATGATAPGGLTFNRRSTVSLSNSWGELRLGRDYVPTFWNFAMFDPFMMQGVASGSNFYFAGTPGPSVSTIRNANSIGYLYNTPQPSGMTGPFMQIQSALGENASSAANASDGRYLGFRAGYVQGPGTIAIAHSKWKNLASKDLTLTNVGMSWNLGFANLMGSYHVANSGLPASRQQTFQLGATVLAGIGYFPMSYMRTKRNDAAGSNAAQFALGYVYNLSKRTALYTNYARIQNAAGAAFVIGGSSPIAGLANATSSGIDFGIRHSF